MKPPRRDFEWDDYDAIDALNFSKLKLIKKSPKRLKSEIKQSSSGFAVGRAAHTLILEPEKFSDLYTQLPDGMIRRGREWEQFLEKTEGRTVLTVSEYSEVSSLLAAAKRCEPARALLAACPRREEIFEAEVRGVSCKCRVDFIGDLIAGDLKTTRDATPEAWSREVIRYDYLAQAAFYLDVIRSATGLDYAWEWLAVEKSDMPDAAVYTVDDDALAYGRRTYDAWLDRYIDCLSRDEWPGIGSEVLQFHLPAWARSDEAEDFTVEELE